MSLRSCIRRFFTWLGTLVLIALVAPAVPKPESEPDGSLVVLQRLRSGPYSYSYESHFKKGFDKVIRNASAWQSIWHNVCADICGADPLTNLNFDKQYVLVSALDTKPTGGFSIILSAAQRTTAGFVIDVVESFPSAGCVLTMAESRAIDIAIITKTKEPIVFHHLRVETAC
jgi:hypothetical protein